MTRFAIALSMTLLPLGLWAAKPVNQSRIWLTQSTLMNETRVTPSPLDGAVVSDRAVSFQWKLEEDNGRGSGLDGFEVQHKTDKSKLLYALRYARTKDFSKDAVQVQTPWPFYNPEKDLAPGVWYWQYGYVKKDGISWGSIQKLTVEQRPDKFLPPSAREFLSKVPATHPRVLVMKDEWDDLIQKSKGKQEYRWYCKKGEEVLKTPMKAVNDINTSQVPKLKNQMQIKAFLTRESRRIIDKEEANCEALIRAYLLTRDKRYAQGALDRILTMIDWDKDPNVKGDFNDATLLSLASMAYDSFYNILTPKEKLTLFEAVKEKATKFYNSYNNDLEVYIADNHVWQMTYRILTMAAVSVYGELNEANTWLNYCYNVWLARLPGLNKDGAWHNGDSYFTVNTRTLIEVPYYFGKLTGFDFFKDPWYQGNVMYTIFQQPPFSKSGGNGSSHLKVTRPRPIRVGYLDALARLTGNSYAADYVKITLREQPNYLRKAFLNKPGDLSWFRLLCDKPLPTGKGLKDLPSGYVFPQTGLASFMTNWSDFKHNAMWSFRSSPYGSTSHALANQNAFNTFYGGESLFYSSGHHVAFTDKHAVYCHRGTRAHNTILADGMGQRIGTEGYGWIPRSYVGDSIGYVLGDASNAYGKVISKLWLQRGKESDLDYSPANGWDENHVKTFRRHMVNLGNSGLIFIYDELEGDRPIVWNYLLHTVAEPIQAKQEKDFVHVKATHGDGVSDAYLLGSGQLSIAVTDTFFLKPVSWLRMDEKGKFEEYPNHWHFTANSEKSAVYRFATIIDTHNKASKAVKPTLIGKDQIKVGNWMIRLNLGKTNAPMFEITNAGGKDRISYHGEETMILENGKQTLLRDEFPELEI